MDDVLAFCQAAYEGTKKLVPKLVWPGDEIEKEVNIYAMFRVLI